MSKSRIIAMVAEDDEAYDYNLMKWQVVALLSQDRRKGMTVVIATSIILIA